MQSREDEGHAWAKVSGNDRCEEVEGVRRDPL
jgi:hypothetical protein